LRHYDMDEIYFLEPFLEDFSQEVEELLRRRHPNLSTAPYPEKREDRLYIHGGRITRRREFLWRADLGNGALLVRTLVHRFIHPSRGEIDNTLEVFVLPESRRAGLVRFLLMAGLPVLGVAVGVLGWYFLQFDTNMVMPPWLVGGLLSGLLLGILLLRGMTQRIAACLEGKQSPLRAKYRQALEDEITAVVERLRQEHSTRAAETPVAPAVIDEPAALHAYIAALAAQTDETILRFGLTTAPNRQAIERAFAHVEADAEWHRAFQEALARLADQPQAAPPAPTAGASAPE